MHDSAYLLIARSIDREPETAPKAADGGGFHAAFLAYLKLLYSPEEAEVVQHLKGLPAFTSTREVADASGKSLESVEKILADVHSRNGLFGVGDRYCLPPIPVLVNVHQFYPEVKEHDVEAARLYGDPVHRSIEPGEKILSAEEAHDFILNHAPEEMALVPCPCRTRTEKLGTRECKEEKPIGACIMLGPAAMHFDDLGLGKRVTRQQAVAYFDEMVENGFVGTTTNSVSNGPVICLCCECCCSQVRGRTRWDNPDAVAPSNFVPRTTEDCLACETCVDRCFFGALEIDEETDRATADPEKCIGCGLCTLACPQEILKLHRHERARPFDTHGELLRTLARENRE
jgi:NAD-dependent dihydropyrimidine dehydrogenase PreA subunit